MGAALKTTVSDADFQLLQQYAATLDPVAPNPE
jgi:hypothetical protein